MFTVYSRLGSLADGVVSGIRGIAKRKPGFIYASGFFSGFSVLVFFLLFGGTEHTRDDERFGNDMVTTGS